MTLREGLDRRRGSGASWTIGGFVQHIGHTTPTRVELWATRSGLELAWDMGICRLILDVDSKIVHRFVSSRKFISS